MSVIATSRRLGAVHTSHTALDSAALVLRGVIAFVFIAHGSQKLFGWFGGGGVDGTTAFFAFLDIPAPRLFAVVAGVTEVVGGLLILFGLLTAVAGLALLVDMALAIVTFNADNGFFVESPGGGWELNFVLIGMLGALVLIGAGSWSIDRSLGLTGSRSDE
jgi:putative oxidoreductase